MAQNRHEHGGKSPRPAIPGVAREAPDLEECARGATALTMPPGYLAHYGIQLKQDNDPHDHSGRMLRGYFQSYGIHSEAAPPAASTTTIQMRSAATLPDDPAQVHDAAARGLSGTPQALPHLDQIQRAFGAYDATSIQAHVGGPAAEASRAMGARAYATGDAVAFAQAPDLHTAAHEAAHVIQQRGGVQLKDGVGDAGDAFERHADAVADRVVAGQSAEALLGEHAGAARVSGTPAAAGLQRKVGGAPVQMLVKTHFPWHGVIVNTSSAALRSSPSKDAARPHEGMVADLPKGTRVRVDGHKGNWLEVKAEVGGKHVAGWVSQELVDDAVVGSMGSLEGTKAKWHGSGPGSGNTFEVWASAASEAAAPPLGPSTTINCWEMILYAAFKAGAIDWKWIHDLYVNQPTSTWVSRMTSGGTTPYDPKTSKLTRGDLVFFNKLAHVALATGKGDEVYTFWPPPDTAFTTGTGGTVDRVKRSTVAKLVDWMKNNGLGNPPVTFGAPVW